MMYTRTSETVRTSRSHRQFPSGSAAHTRARSACANSGVAFRCLDCSHPLAMRRRIACTHTVAVTITARPRSQAFRGAHLRREPARTNSTPLHSTPWRIPIRHDGPPGGSYEYDGRNARGHLAYIMSELYLPSNLLNSICIRVVVQAGRLFWLLYVCGRFPHAGCYRTTTAGEGNGRECHALMPWRARAIAAGGGAAGGVPAGAVLVPGAARRGRCCCTRPACPASAPRAPASPRPTP